MVDGTTNNAWLEISDRGTHKLNGGCSIGRSSVNQVVLAAEKVSRRHAIINAADNGEFWLVDLGSSNGTYVDGVPIVSCVLKGGDMVQFGRNLFLFDCLLEYAETKGRAV